MHADSGKVTDGSDVDTDETGVDSVEDIAPDDDDDTDSRAPRAIAIAAAALALLLIAATVGYYVGQGRPPSRDSVEVGFLYDMISHHEQAQYMSNIELVNGSEESIKVFAREILLFQSYEIGLMQARLEDWGYVREDPPPKAMEWMGHATARDAMPGMASEARIQQLLMAKGRDADALFIDLMQAHHRGGVDMAEYAAKRIDDRRIRTLAAAMARNQRAEIGELQAAKTKAGLGAGATSPSGTSGPAGMEGH